MKQILMLVVGILIHNFSMAQLVVHSARWEIAGGGANCDATRQLTAACNGLRECQIPVNEENLCDGDPAYGIKKVLDIHYSCDGVRQAPAGFPDNSLASLQCRRIHMNKPQLQIRYARWEVREGGAGCDATTNIARACNGKEGCEVYVAPPYVCQRDPAYGQFKRLDVEYSCGGAVQRRLAFEDRTLAQIRCPDRYQNPQHSRQPQHPQQPLHGSNGNSGGSGGLKVINARWEVIGGGPWCDATPQMTRACDGRGQCQLPVEANYLCGGDPAVGRVKRLDIKYMCNGVMQPMVGFQDFAQATLQCGNGPIGGPPATNPVERQLLQVTFARWELNGGGPWCDAISQMAAACNGRRSCQVPVEPRSLCNDPAPNRYKTLEVRYTCRGRPQSTLGFPDGSQAVLRCD